MSDKLPRMDYRQHRRARGGGAAWQYFPAPAGAAAGT